MLSLLAWVRSNPYIVAILLLVVATGFYKWRSDVNKDKAKTEQARADGATEAIKRVAKREKSLADLERKQKRENETLDNLIRNRSYFDSVDGL